MICWVLVMFDICIDVVVSGKVDLECGFMISNFECQKCVVFLLIIFVVGMKVMVKCGVLICLFCDFVGKKVVVMVGMINEKMLCDLNDKFWFGIQLQVVLDYVQGFVFVVNGGVDVFVMDDVLLYGFIVENVGKGGQYDVVGDFFLYDLYGIMFCKDDL